MADEKVSPDALAKIHHGFRAMILSRTLENKLSSLYKAGKIVGGVYLGKGQEAISASLGTVLIKGKDVYAPLIRDQAGRTAFGEDLLDVTRTYLGKVTGPMKGRDGNVHRGRPKEGMPAMISHLGASLSYIAGMLFARRLRGELNDAIGAATFGDGATSTGAFHEGLNLAAVENLPIIVLVVNNSFAYSTPNDRQFSCDNLISRAEGYGVTGYEVDGTDVLACMDVMTQAAESARAGNGPQLIVANALRLCGHGEHDDAKYIPDELRAQSRDCIEVAESQMQENGFLSPEEIANIKQESKVQVTEAVAIAQREPTPDPRKDDWQALGMKNMIL